MVVVLTLITMVIASVVIAGVYMVGMADKEGSE